ncbi:cell division protein FtsL [Clostridium sp. chh4-2]|uniref:septum formation initiator family protein n=1 Tax=Clostridium sp. chh4-2 TaxID=2067550 RepID=UPI000CCDF311|nr:septum formation initiator family protein [Clostridium sp. chh4-2]PNV61456.1 cell division protein FtsL [Clostridium sp. chh4-2]
MATRRQAPVNRHHEYIEGNTVRKIASPEKRPAKRTPEIKHHSAVDHTVRRNQAKALNMDLPYLLALTVAAICALYLCVNYLHIQSSITARIHNIENLEKEVEVLKSQNDALETRINTYVDLDYVYKVATEELGMVYANKDQVLLYDKTESEYVRQYEDIPKH